MIAGEWGGRRLATPAGRTTRPTSDRVREAAFSRLSSRYRLPGARVLDLYAGSGALGIEALSRGAASAVWVESDRGAAAVIEKNLTTLGGADRGRVVVADAVGAIARLAGEGLRFDGVFLDPPYGQGLVEPTLARLAAAGLLAEGGWVVAETERGEAAAGTVTGLVAVREDLYGDTKLALYERSG